MVQRLKLYLEFHGLLDRKQSGFRARRRTADHILRLHDAVQKALANKHNVLAIFIDIEKAYDMVNKTVLLSKLLKLGINGEMWRFICYVYMVSFALSRYHIWITSGLFLYVIC